MLAARKTVLSLVLAPVLLGGFTWMAGCATAPTTPQAKRSLSDDVQDTLHDLRNEDPSLDSFLGNSYAYVIFPSIGKGGAGITGAYGRGEVFVQGKFTGYADMSQGAIGAALGGETYREIIVFENGAALADFEANKLEFEADASAVALKAGAAAMAKYNDKGVAVFAMPSGGLMFDASIGGQQFTYQAATPGGASTTQPSGAM
jgi:lipid-binding SYLF domain-containing protein